MNCERDESTYDLEWAAFRYVAGEMTSDEARALEERMAGDQAAREAVSRAAMLGSRLVAARSQSDAARTPATRVAVRRQYRAAAWGAIVVAASVLVVVGWRGSQRPAAPHPDRSPLSPSQATPVDAVAWLQVRGVGNSTALVEQEWEESEPDELSSAESNEPVVPQWMLATSVNGKGK